MTEIMIRFNKKILQDLPSKPKVAIGLSKVQQNNVHLLVIRTFCYQRCFPDSVPDMIMIWFLSEKYDLNHRRAGPEMPKCR